MPHHHPHESPVGLLAWLFEIFTPRRVCMYEQVDVIATHLLGDTLITLAYFSIPLMLLALVRKRPEPELIKIFYLFSSFILLCGLTHAVSVLAIWAPPYRLDGYLKVATGLVSMVTAYQLYKLMPVAASLASPAQLEATVRERTAQLREVAAAHARSLKELKVSNEDLDQLAYVASHDLRAPLRGIGNLAEWLDEDAGASLSDESREHLRQLRQGVLKMSAMLDGILLYSSVSHGDVTAEAVDSARCATDAAALLRMSDVIEIGPMPSVLAVSTQIEQVFSNLLSNAQKHAPDARVRIRGERGESGMVEFTVSDDGPGIDERDQLRLFDLFHGAAAEGVPSAGVGLAVVKKLVERNGGSVRIDSAAGRGATFRFTWPAAPDLEEPDSERAANSD